MEEKCEECSHEICKICKQCHNMDCEYFGKPLNACFNQLLPKKPNPPTVC